jgi:hypothetical protein
MGALLPQHFVVVACQGTGLMVQQQDTDRHGKNVRGICREIQGKFGVARPRFRSRAGWCFIAEFIASNQSPQRTAVTT